VDHRQSLLLHRFLRPSSTEALPSTGIVRLPQYYEPLRHPIRPGLSLASRRLIHTAITARASRVAPGPLLPACRRHYPGRFGGSCSLVPFPLIGLPESTAGRHLHHGFRGLLSVHSRYGLHACRVACAILLHRRLQRLCYLHHCSDCYRVERTSSRVGIAPTVDQAPFTAHADHPINSEEVLEFWLEPTTGSSVALDS
jgi:hypothetical protein